MRQPLPADEEQDQEQRQAIMRRNERIIALLDSWEQEDAEEQRETLATLLRSLDEHPLSFRGPNE